MSEDTTVAQAPEQPINICRHFWAVSSWRISDHSESAQELFCQHCGKIVDHMGMDILRRNHVLPLVPSH